MSRYRRSILGAMVALLVLASGCVGFLVGNEPLTVESSEASVDSQTLAETGYEHNRTVEHPLERSFEIAGQTREVRATNHLSEYHRAVDLPLTDTQQRAAVFVVFTTPKVDIAGRTLNPVGDMSNRELLQEVQSQYDSVQVGDKRESYTVQTLDTDATVDTFDGTARMGLLDLEVRFQITTIEHGDDFVIALGVYPAILPGEGENVRSLIRAIEH